IVIDTEIPEFEEFKSPDNFREVFHKYETAVLKARNIAVSSHFNLLILVKIKVTANRIQTNQRRKNKYFECNTKEQGDSRVDV
ncbi:MAG: hypothetical protein WA125_11860, partial [Desulfosporosinus sp.]